MRVRANAGLSEKNCLILPHWLFCSGPRTSLSVLPGSSVMPVAPPPYQRSRDYYPTLLHGCVEVAFSEVPHSPSPIQQIVLCGASEVRSPMYIRTANTSSTYYGPSLGRPPGPR